jgi:hypothetical protein
VRIAEEIEEKFGAAAAAAQVQVGEPDGVELVGHRRGWPG